MEIIMTLERFINIYKRKILLNFAIRNQSPYGKDLNIYRDQWKARKRESIRKAIKYVRLASDPVTADAVREIIAFRVG